ncbi:MAG: amidohydrolase, partial [Trebonia sp.]
MVDNSAADLVFHNGNILTLVPGAPPAEAIAVKDGLVQAVGSANDLRRLTGAGTEVVNLQKRTVIPGVNDGHIHPMGIGTFRPPFTLGVGKDKVKSIAEIRDVIAAAVRSKRPGEWIRGFGWDQGYLAEGRFPSRQDLDDIAPGNPVVLTQWSGHATWVNSKALELAGITRDTPSPNGGEIVKDGRGEPTGILLEAASFAMNAVIPPLTVNERRQALILAARLMESEGITSITDAGIDLATVDLYADLVAAGEFRQRLTIMIMASLVGDLREALLTVRKRETDPRRMNVSQVKIAADGVPTQARTAWVSEPYVGGGHGRLILPGDSEEEQLAQYREWVMTAHDLGFQVGTHATGDRAIDLALGAYEQANRELSDKHLRHYVIHG